MKKDKWECRVCNDGSVCRITSNFKGFTLSDGDLADRCPFMAKKAKFIRVK